MESMVREATNADPWGAPSTKLDHEVSEQILTICRYADAANRRWNAQLSAAERDHADDLQKIHRQNSGGMEADIQGTPAAIAQPYETDAS